MKKILLVLTVVSAAVLAGCGDGYYDPYYWDYGYVKGNAADEVVQPDAWDAQIEAPNLGE